MQVDLQTLVTVIVVLFGREAGAKAIRALWEHRDGRADSKKSRVRDLEEARACAEADRDHQAKWRRILQEYASVLRSMLLERGVGTDDMPPVPSEPPKRDRR